MPLDWSLFLVSTRLLLEWNLKPSAEVEKKKQSRRYSSLESRVIGIMGMRSQKTFQNRLFPINIDAALGHKSPTLNEALLDYSVCMTSPDCINSTLPLMLNLCLPGMYC